jgi:hypothetical protein
MFSPVLVARSSTRIASSGTPDPGHRLGLRFRPVLRHPPARAGKEDPRGEPAMEQVRGVGGDAQVVAAEDQDAVARGKVMVQPVVVPQDERGGEVVGVHNVAAVYDRRTLAAWAAS